METIDDMINNADTNICKNISRFDDLERGLLSQNILSQLRNFVEYMCMKLHFTDTGITVLHTDERVKLQNESAMKYVRGKGQYSFVTKFHKLLQLSASHYTFDEEVSERLMLKYYEYLLKLKDLAKRKFNIEVLTNIENFPVKLDPLMVEYYTKIANKITSQEAYKTHTNKYNERYYIQKIKPFFINQNVYYEITFTTALNNISKFDRIIAFSEIDIPDNYAVKFKIHEDTIEVLNKQLPILIVDDFDISIRPCEFNNFFEIFGPCLNYSTTGKEYIELMSYLKATNSNLSEIISLSDKDYRCVKNLVLKNVKTHPIFNILDKARSFVKNEMSGSNILRYLMYTMNNKVIKSQFSTKSCSFLSNLYLKYGCGVFDKMPFNSSLLNHNPLLRDLLECIDVNGREHELFGRKIRNNTEFNGKLYTNTIDINSEIDIDRMIQQYNAKVYYKHQGRKIIRNQNNIFIKEYEENTINIIRKLVRLSDDKVIGYRNSVESWLGNTKYNIDCPNKKDFLLKMFEESKVALIYGSAGPGKSTIINHISHFFHDKQKVYLANTNPAIENLKRKVTSGNSEFMTITKYLSKSYISYCDILFIDECSTVNNRDMISILEKSSAELLVLVGDTYQIESINFGNWFGIMRNFIKSNSVFELTHPYRTQDDNLLSFWSKVRNLDDDILELMTRNGYTVRLDKSIFEITCEDEIVLCLNYDGLYGINNLNKFLQSSNPNKEILWGVAPYKIGDPILFNDSERFAPVIYNNLKGVILNIEPYESEIYFTLEVDKAINSLDAKYQDFELVGVSEEGKSTIRFSVNKHRSTDEDDDSTSKAIIPFQVAYAVSIHKSQGLEYESVKIVITDEVGERISHNVFYTAITRTKKHLKIYWLPETEKQILEGFKLKKLNREVNILKGKV